MTYDKAKDLLYRSATFGYEVIEDAIRTMPREEFELIPVIDDHTRIVAQRFGICFTVYRDNDYERYYRMYLISSCILREKEQTKHP